MTGEVQDIAVTAEDLLGKLASVLDAVSAATEGLICQEDRLIANAHFNLGDALWNQEQDAQGALEEFCAALAKNPEHVDALCGIASVLGERGDIDGAVKALRKALAIAPRHSLAHFYLGSALGRRGDFDGAVMEYQAVLEYDENSAVATLARANLEAAARITVEHPLTYERGMPAEAIKQIDAFRWGEEGSSVGENLQTCCAICIKDFNIGEEVRKLPCKHIFHSPCIDEWLRRCTDCPLCKSNADES